MNVNVSEETVSVDQFSNFHMWGMKRLSAAGNNMQNANFTVMCILDTATFHISCACACTQPFGLHHSHETCQDKTDSCDKGRKMFCS